MNKSGIINYQPIIHKKIPTERELVLVLMSFDDLCYRFAYFANVDL